MLKQNCNKNTFPVINKYSYLDEITLTLLVKQTVIISQIM
jgi:hypothetical protein